MVRPARYHAQRGVRRPTAGAGLRGAQRAACSPARFVGAQRPRQENQVCPFHDSSYLTFTYLRLLLVRVAMIYGSAPRAGFYRDLSVLSRAFSRFSGNCRVIVGQSSGSSKGFLWLRPPHRRGVAVLRPPRNRRGDAVRRPPRNRRGVAVRRPPHNRRGVAVLRPRAVLRPPKPRPPHRKGVAVLRPPAS